MIGSVVLQKKMLTDDAQRTTHDDGRQHLAIGHLSELGDLKIFLFDEDWRVAVCCETWFFLQTLQ